MIDEEPFSFVSAPTGLLVDSCFEDVVYEKKTVAQRLPPIKLTGKVFNVLLLAETIFIGLRLVVFFGSTVSKHKEENNTKSITKCVNY